MYENELVKFFLPYNIMPSIFYLIFVFVSLILASKFIKNLIKKIIEKFMEKFIENKFQQNMENYKHELSLISEQCKFDYQRKITDFNLFTKEKHQVYKELFSLILVAFANAKEFGGMRHLPDFNQFDKSEMEGFLEKFELTSMKKIELLDIWENDKANCTRIINDFLDRIRVGRSVDEKYSATNYFYKNILHISDDIENLVKNIFNNITEINIFWEIEVKSKHFSGDLLKMREVEDKLSKLIYEDLKNLMKKELSVGYYEKEKESLQKQPALN